MKRLLFAVLCATLSFSFAAQPVRFAPPRPISIDRLGIAGFNTSNPVVASNGQSFLVAWADDLSYLESRVGPMGQLGRTRAIRIGLDGTPLDDVALGTGLYHPVDAAWTGSEWVILIYDGFARVGANGELISAQKGPWWAVDSFMVPMGMAWTGETLVVAGISGSLAGQLRVLTFDPQLNLLHDEVVSPEAQPLGLASDGQSAVLVYSEFPFDLSQAKVYAARFGRNGVFETKRSILTGRTVYGGALAATANGYLWHFKMNTPEAWWINRDLRVTATKKFEDFENALNGADPIVWDGSRLTSYTVGVPFGSDTQTSIVAAQFSDGGTFLQPLRAAVQWSRPINDLAAAAANGKTLLGYVWSPTNTARPASMMVRAFSNPAGFASAPDIAVERGVFKQELFAAASGRSMSVAVWHERTSTSMPWSIYATRISPAATVLDPASLLLGDTTCVKIPPAVATDGRDFLAAWMDTDRIAIGRVRADGSGQQTHSVANVSGCGVHPLALESNGTEYLLVWRANDRILNGLRLRADGTRIDPAPFTIANLAVGEGNAVRVESNGDDYLVGWDGHATRVTSQGVVVDRNFPIELGAGTVAQVWWNNRTYVVEMVDTAGHRFLRIGSDGTGGRPASGPQPPVIPFLFSGSWTMPQSVVCDAGGCTGAVVQRQWANNRHTITLVRYDDDGANITIRPRPAPDFEFDAPDDLTPVPADIIGTGQLAVLYLPQILARPYSLAHRVWIAPLPPRARAVRH
jgi:hypothetical protein